jgi:hypothetical protein
LKLDLNLGEPPAINNKLACSLAQRQLCVSPPWRQQHAWITDFRSTTPKPLYHRAEELHPFDHNFGGATTHSLTESQGESNNIITLDLKSRKKQLLSSDHIRHISNILYLTSVQVVASQSKYIL